jgi:hypothetical protein
MARAELKARATLDNTGFQRGVAGMQQSVQGFASGQMRQLGGMIGSAFAVGAVVNFAKRTMEAADNMQDMARNLGIGIEQMQALQLMAQRTGSSAEYMNGVLMRAAKEGVKIEDVAKAYMGVEGSSVSLEQAHRVLGRQAAQLNDTMNQLANDGLDSVTQKLLQNNQIMSEDSVNAAAKMQEAYEKAAASISNTLAAAFVKIIEKVKLTSAFLGALSGGATMDEASNIAANTVNAELYAKDSPLKQGLALPPKKMRSAIEKEISVSAPQAADSLAKIGGLVGGQTDPLKGLIERQLKIMEAQEKAQAKIQAAAERTADNTEALVED